MIRIWWVLVSLPTLSLSPTKINKCKHVFDHLSFWSKTQWSALVSWPRWTRYSGWAPRQTVAAFLPLSSGSTPVYLLLVRETCREQFAVTSWGEGRRAKLEEGKGGEEMLFWTLEAEPHRDGQKPSHNVHGGGELEYVPPWGPWARGWLPGQDRILCMG